MEKCPWKKGRESKFQENNQGKEFQSSDCQKVFSSFGHFGFHAGHLIEFNRGPLPDIW